MRELLRVKGVPGSVKVINLAGEPLATSLVDPDLPRDFDAKGL
jgi:hypothetical protein